MMVFIGVITYSTSTPYIRLVSGITSAVLKKKKKKERGREREREREGERLKILKCDALIDMQESYFLRIDYQETMRRIQHLWEAVQRFFELFTNMKYFPFKDSLTFLEKIFRRREGLQTIK